MGHLILLRSEPSLLGKNLQRVGGSDRKHVQQHLCMAVAVTLLPEPDPALLCGLDNRLLASISCVSVRESGPENDASQGGNGDPQDPYRTAYYGRGMKEYELPPGLGEPQRR